MSTSGGPPIFKAGQNLVCRVTGRTPTGYDVVLKKTNHLGYVKTGKLLELGCEILAQFVCFYRGKVLLTPIFGREDLYEKPPSQIDNLVDRNNVVITRNIAQWNRAPAEE